MTYLSRIYFIAINKIHCLFGERSEHFKLYMENNLSKKLLITAMLATLGMTTNAMADNLLEVMTADGGFKTLLSAIKTAGLEETFKAKGPMTIFAPTDLAFKNMTKPKLDALLNDKAKLKKVLSYSIVPAKITSDDVAAGKVKTLEGDSMKLSVDGVVKVDDAPVVANENAANGVIHAVNTVLMPKS